MYGTSWYQRKGFDRMKGKKAVIATGRAKPGRPEQSVRERVLKAAFGVFRTSGFSGGSRLEVATRAKVSKRGLDALFGSKHAMLAACIKERAARMRRPLELAAPVPESSAAVAATLAEFGTSILRVVSHPDVLTVHRLAVSTSEPAPDVARTLHRNFRP